MLTLNFSQLQSIYHIINTATISCKVTYSSYLSGSLGLLANIS